MPRGVFVRPPLHDRFWAKVNKNGRVVVPELGPCWEWTGGTTRGYGTFWNGERTVPAPRWAYEEAHGPVPSRLYVCHKCDNPLCVRDEHLFVGTPKENRLDSVGKGRDASGERSPRSLHPDTVGYQKGERHLMARLSAAQVAEMRAAHAAGEKQASLVRRFGVSPAAVSMIVRGLRW